MSRFAELGLRLLTRPECHLCEEAIAALTAFGVEFETIEVDSDRELAGRYGDRIPMLLARDVEIAAAPIDHESLTAALRGLGARAGGSR